MVGADPWVANAVKLCGNFLIAAALESLGEAFALVRKSGVDAGQFLEIINSALFNSALYGNYGAAIAKEQFEPAGFKLLLGFKDLRLVQEAAESAAVPMPLAGVLRDRLGGHRARGRRIGLGRGGAHRRGARRSSRPRLPSTPRINWPR